MFDIDEEVTRTLDRIKLPLPMRTGTLLKVVGMTLHARGLIAPIGALCEVESTLGNPIQAEVVGFHHEILFLILLVLHILHQLILVYQFFPRTVLLFV